MASLFACITWGTGLLLASCLWGSLHAQQAQLLTTSPAANASSVAPTALLSFTFNQALSASATAALQVYSAQRGGRRTRANTPARVRGNSLFFDPGSQPWLPGETLMATLRSFPSTASLTAGRVVQFTVATAGRGRGYFQPGQDANGGLIPTALAVGDVDGDGDVDALTVLENTHQVLVRLNGGDAMGTATGSFRNGSVVDVGPYPVSVTLGDVDGDGDLDLLTSNFSSPQGTVSVRLNGGDNSGSQTGLFSHGSEVMVGPVPRQVVLGDVDGDGDLDLVTANENGNSVSVRLNGGDATGSATGIFSQGSEVKASLPRCVALGDVDGDGDLDLVVANQNTPTMVSIRLNGGDATGSATGTFSQGSEVAVENTPFGLALADVDGDSDLDLITANNQVPSGTASVRLNGGDASGSHLGVFSQGEDVPIGVGAYGLALGDVDGDGDVDLATANLADNTVSVRFNSGTGAGGGPRFGQGVEVAVGLLPVALVLTDVDGDADLDIMAASYEAGNQVGEGTLKVRLNQPLPRPTFTVFPTIGTGDAPIYSYTGPPLPLGSSLTLYTVIGQRVHYMPVALSGTGPLLTQGLASGWYFARLSTPTGSYVARFYQP